MEREPQRGMDLDSTVNHLVDFETHVSSSDQVTIVPKIDLDFGNVVQLRLLFFNILKNNISNIKMDLQKVKSIDEITFDVLMEIAKKMEIYNSDWNLEFVNSTPHVMDLIKETPITYIYENVNIK